MKRSKINSGTKPVFARKRILVRPLGSVASGFGPRPGWDKRLSEMFVMALSCFLPACGWSEEEMKEHSYHAAAPSSEHSQHHHEMHHSGSYGPYPATRENSGTSWQPEATPMEGLHHSVNYWNMMLHGFATLIYDNQGGHRGDEAIFGTSMLMFMAQHPVGAGTFGFRSMLSLEPATIRDSGYPLLLQTGETGNGTDPLIDRQHAHDLFMELALTYSHPIGQDSSAFAFFGLPGEPALGPPAFMHRFSGMDNPEAPITHHWLDSTHISWGVGTIGYVWKQFKMEGSIFTGRESDEHRWDFDRPRFDSHSARLSWNPTACWSFQASYGWIHSPEQLHTEVDVERPTISGSYHKAWKSVHWQTTAAWGQNRNDPGRNLDAFMLESAVRFRDTHTVFGRAENVEKDELFPAGDPQAGRKFTVNKVSAGYIYDFPKLAFLRLGIGGVGSIHLLPSALDAAYGDTPLSFMLFLRAKL